jgi:hypothetical protein
MTTISAATLVAGCRPTRLGLATGQRCDPNVLWADLYISIHCWADQWVRFKRSLVRQTIPFVFTRLSDDSGANELSAEMYDHRKLRCCSFSRNSIRGGQAAYWAENTPSIELEIFFDGIELEILSH